MNSSTMEIVNDGHGASKCERRRLICGQNLRLLLGGVRYPQLPVNILPAGSGDQESTSDATPYNRDECIDVCVYVCTYVRIGGL